MKADEMKVGVRVVLVDTIHDDNSPGSVLGTIPGGSTGTVVAVFPDAHGDAGEHYAEVKFDAPVASLEDWDNVLHVFNDTDADVVPLLFDLI